MTLLLKHWKPALILLVMTSCGASHHLKKSEKHLAIAIAKGAKVENKVDTIFQDVVVQVPVIMNDTIVKLSTDTIRISKDGIETKILVRDKKVYIKQVVKSPPITIRRTVHVHHTKTIKAGKTAWEYWTGIIGGIIFGIVVGALVGRLFWR